MDDSLFISTVVHHSPKKLHKGVKKYYFRDEAQTFVSF